MKKTLYILLLTISFSCSNKTHTENEKIKIGGYTESISLKNIFSNLEIIPLETSNNSILYKSSRIKFYDDKFFIYSRQLASIHIFSKKGKFISKINNVGRGPQEYLELFDFDIYSKKLFLFSISK